MNNRSIGVFDSGLGGLTAVKQIMRELPDENIIYFGDTGRVPYGTRSAETILKYTRDDIRFLKSFDVKIIVVACGTVSSVALPTVREESDIPVVGVVDAAVYAAVRSTAKCTPLSSAPSTFKGRGFVAPVQITTASNSLTTFTAG